MKRISKKRSALLRKVKPLRDQYKAMFPWCQVPLCAAKATELHEISRGSSRGKSLGVRAALLHLCAFDHGQMDVLPVAGQLALKLLADPDGYDRIAVNLLRGRQPEAISAEEVAAWVKILQRAEEMPDVRSTTGMASSPAQRPKAKAQAQGLGNRMPADGPR